jgi:hypothetical protein
LGLRQYDSSLRFGSIERFQRVPVTIRSFGNDFGTLGCCELLVGPLAADPNDKPSVKHSLKLTFPEAMSITAPSARKTSIPMMASLAG